jgi:hypothetical protein
MDNSLDEHAKAIGLLCMEWSRLEGDIKNCFLKLSGWPNQLGSRAMLNCLDVRQLLTALKIGAFAMRYNQEACSRLASTVDYIDNYLRPARNRCVHDQWSAVDGGAAAFRYAASPSIRKTSQKPIFRWVEDGSAALVTSIEILTLVRDVETQREYLKLVIGWVISYPPEFEFPANGAEPPPRHLLPLHEEKPNRTGKKGVKRQPQPESSQE